MSTEDNAAARVVEAFGRRCVVELTGGERVACEVFGKRLAVVCGDLVRITFQPGNDTPRITERLPRTSVLARTDAQGRAEDLAANLTLLIVLLAPEPPSDPFVVDRYLAGAALVDLQAMVVANKADLAGAAQREYRQTLDDFVQAGYRVLEVSAAQGTGIETLRECIRHETAMLVGQSGVGKSSLTNALVPEVARPTRSISESTREGRHTTTSSALFTLPSGGELIDSPGVRDYAPAPVGDATIQHGWREIIAVAPDCRFSNCLHLREPGCAVARAVEAGSISQRRYESYRRLVNLMRQLLPSYERPR
jgi:ribosome biogenesis GTPase